MSKEIVKIKEKKGTCLLDVILITITQQREDVVCVPANTGRSAELCNPSILDTLYIKSGSKIFQKKKKKEIRKKNSRNLKQNFPPAEHYTELTPASDYTVTKRPLILHR